MLTTSSPYAYTTFTRYGADMIRAMPACCHTAAVIDKFIAATMLIYCWRAMLCHVITARDATEVDADDVKMLAHDIATFITCAADYVSDIDVTLPALLRVMPLPLLLMPLMLCYAGGAMPLFDGCQAMILDYRGCYAKVI